jgi:autotransporter adhesin
MKQGKYIATILSLYFAYAPAMVFAADNNTTTGSVGIVIDGENNTVSSSNSVTLGNHISSRGGANVAIGYGSKAGHQEKPLGPNDANGATAVGTGSQAVNYRATALGDYTVASGTDAIGIGTTAQATGDRSISSGASGVNAIAIGDKTISTSNDTVAIGEKASATNSQSIAIGSSSSSSGSYSVAIGLNAKATNGWSVALGNSSETAAAVSTSTMAVGGKTYQTAGGTAMGTLSVGNEAVKRTVTNVAAGRVTASSTDAVNGSQLFAITQSINENTQNIAQNTAKIISNTTEINKIKDGKGFTDKGKEVIRDLAKGSVKVIAGTNTTVTEGADGDAKTYAVNVEGNGKVESGNTGLISGGTAYTELRPADGSYVKQSNTTASNLTALDTQLKTTSDLIHTNTAGDTIQIGGDSKATKIDVSGKDKDGKSTGRVITGVVTDAKDPNSAANVGYVNGITSASNEQIYHDMNMQYNHVENDISRAAAGSNALAALHPMQEFDPDDKAQFALGYGHYRNSNAGAVGAFYQPDENSMVNFGVSFGNGDAGINAGVTFKFGPGGSGHHALTKTQMAKVIDAQSKEIDELKKDNADKDKRIDALEQKMTEILAKLDKSKD